MNTVELKKAADFYQKCITLKKKFGLTKYNISVLLSKKLFGVHYI